MPDIFELISKNCKPENLLNFISLRAFFLGDQYCPWAIINEQNELNLILNKFISHVDNFYDFNKQNISKIGIKITDISYLTENKKTKLIKILDDIINSFLIEDILIIDKVYNDPFKNDDLFDFINVNKAIVSNDIYIIYKNRHDSLIKLLSLTNYKITNDFKCIDKAKRNKIFYYWKSIVRHPGHSIIENLKL